MTDYEIEMKRLEARAMARATAIQQAERAGQLKVTRTLTSYGKAELGSHYPSNFCTAQLCDGSGKVIIEVKNFQVHPDESTASIGARILAAFKNTPKVAGWLAGAGSSFSRLLSSSAFSLVPASVGYLANAKDASDPTKLAAMVAEVKRQGLTPEQVTMIYPGAHVQIIESLRKEALGIPDA